MTISSINGIEMPDEGDTVIMYCDGWAVILQGRTWEASDEASHFIDQHRTSFFTTAMTMCMECPERGKWKEADAAR